MRRLIDLAEWGLAIAATAAIIALASDRPKLSADPVPSKMTGPSAEETIRALGGDPADVFDPHP